MQSDMNLSKPDPSLPAILRSVEAMRAAQRDSTSLDSMAHKIEKIDQGEGVVHPVQREDTLPVLDAAALHGLAGEFTKAVEPYSEAHPMGILLHVLVAGGCLIGSGPHALVEHTPHPARLNALLVGPTAGGRKGMAWSTPRHLFSQVDEEWTTHRVLAGLSSGEGLIYAVRDADGADPGVVDKRLLVIEPEFASALAAMERQGNTLSPKIREAWDGGNLRPMTKRERIGATGAHISIVGHITQEELLRTLTLTERANGLANRFLFALVRQSKYLPCGKGVPQEILEPYFIRFAHTIQSARTRGIIARDSEAEALWAQVYPKLEEEVGGLTGAILARASAQVLRLSLLYSLLDEGEAKQDKPAIRVPHLLAALAVWDYCKASVLHIFGDAVGDSIADRLLRAIKSGPQTDTDLYEALGKHDGGRKDPALDLLLRLRRVHAVKVPTSGRPIREWHHGTQQGCVLCVKRV